MIHELRDELLEEKELVDRFAQEAKLAAGFAHPNVVTIFDFGIADPSRAFLVMELLEGQTLRETIQKEHALPGTRVIEIMRGVSAAVDAAHARHLIHRDLKPENILLARTDRGEVPKVLDFGIAKMLAPNFSSAQTATGIAMGTPLYMSPEQLRVEAPAACWDVWALSVIAYEMLIGSHPFASEGRSNSQQAILAGQFQPVSNQPLQDLFKRCFAPVANQRPRTANELFQAIGSLY